MFPRSRRSSEARFFLIGEAVSASLSPYLHNSALAALGERGVYEALSLPLANLDACLAAWHGSNIRGLNITTPYKKTIVKHLSLQDPLVQSLGATNTLLWEPGAYRAFNTDVWGFEKSLETLPCLKGSTIAVLGAGGAARAVLAVLLQKGTKRIFLVNRSLGRLQAVREQFQDSPTIISYLADDPLLASLSGLDGLIQTSSARLAEPFPLSFSQLSPSAFIYDLNYEPQGTTLLIAHARSLGFKAQDGRQMLAAQAAKAMALWLGSDAEELNMLYQGIMQKRP